MQWFPSKEATASQSRNDAETEGAVRDSSISRASQFVNFCLVLSGQYLLSGNEITSRRSELVHVHGQTLSMQNPRVGS